MNLVLPTRANWSQPINFIKENNWWPHQVSLTKRNTEVHVMHKRGETVKHGPKRRYSRSNDDKNLPATLLDRKIGTSPGQRVSVAAVQIPQPTCWGSLPLFSWKTTLFCHRDYTRSQAPVPQESFLSLEVHRINILWNRKTLITKSVKRWCKSIT